MIQIKSTSIRNLDLLSITHYEGVKSIIMERLDSLQVPHTIRDFLDLPGKLKAIVTAKPDQLLILESELNYACRRHRIRTAGKWLPQVFNYTTFSNKNHAPYNAYHLAANLDVKVCPYCNRQYTFTVVNTRTNIARPAFDHFFDKKRHPLLGLSFFNLIPSCHLCNSTLKHTRQFFIDSHVHPYVGGFGEVAKFNYLAKDYDSAIGNADNLTIEMELDEVHVHAEKVGRNMEVFRLKEIYQGHRDIVRELVRKFHISNGEYLKSLQSTFPQIGTKEELYQLAFGNYFREDDFDKRVLAKLTKDIATRLLLLENIHLLFVPNV